MPILNKAIVFDKENFGDGLKKALQMTPDDILLTVKNSILKGRGGAGFPAGVKWVAAAATPSDKKYVVCNADEGEPGTFKDRVLLTEFTEQVYNGMIICGYSIGAHYGFVYLRGEYSYMREHMEKTLEDMRNSNRLGKNILGSGFDFDIEIRLGSGAYVCGEESALIESLEGLRGEPRNRPPYPVDRGYLGYPTVVNNVETLATVPIIINKGVEWFTSIGTEKSKGSKLISVSGDVEFPGVYEIPYGTTIAEVLDIVGAKDVKAVQVGGASGVCIPEEDLARNISFEDVPTGGSIIVFNHSRDMLKILKNFMEFFTEESCGQCTPCRIGNKKLLDGINLIEEGKCSVQYLRELISLGEIMQIASKCGLGQSSPNSFITIMTHFGDEILANY
ncbi:MAG TPA: NADH-ubiquinone oxidoreductase-F iron-sulfur binding region domain-containing protein [Bacteroidota bacterium]|nr:NADH-ubiquinone oxidoreductase-F iron-sulfur binding region domain-containing protein [Bacteroidota bacterium]